MSEPFDPYRKWLGIPPSEQPPHHYRLLGIAALEDDPDVIDNAANRQMAHVRTFQHGPNAAISQRLLTELSAAKLCLLTPERKLEYDAQLRERLAPTVPLGPPQVASIFPDVRAAGPRFDVGFQQASTTLPEALATAGEGEFAGGPLVRSVSSMHATQATKARQRRLVLPIALTVISAIVLVSIGLVILLFGNPLHDQAESEPRSKTTGHSQPAESLQNVDSTVAALPASQKINPEKTGELLEGIRQALFRGRQALADRKFDDCRKELALADQLLAKQSLPETPRLQQEADDLRVLAAIVERFWAIVQDNALHKVQLGEKLTFRKRALELIARNGDQIELRIDGAAYKGRIREIEPWPAVLLSFKTIKLADPIALLPIAAFLAVDAKATDSDRRLAKQFYALARAAGEKNEALSRQLGLRTPDDPIKLDADLTPKKAKAKKTKA